MDQARLAEANRVLFCSANEKKEKTVGGAHCYGKHTTVHFANVNQHRQKLHALTWCHTDMKPANQTNSIPFGGSSAVEQT